MSQEKNKPEKISTDNDNIVFVYFKDGKIKVLSIIEAIEQKCELEQENWVHTATLDSRRYIEYLFNQAEDVDVASEIRELSYSPKKIL